MSVGTRLGPTDHGREMSYEEYLAGDYEQGYKYELIDGRLYVSPMANFSHEWHLKFIEKLLEAWAAKHPEVIGWVSRASRVFVRKRRKATTPEPDLAGFREKPTNPHTRWEDLSPLVVVEIMGSDWEKDLVRNVELYAQIPSIFEYWVLDVLEDLDHPTLKVFRRDEGDQPWITAEYASDAVYRTPLLPRFELPVTATW